jgi:DNA recombination protein RmuC
MSDIGTRIDWSDPLLLGLVGGVAFLILLLILLIAVLKAARQAGRAAEPLAEQVTMLGKTVATLGQGQQQLVGGLTQVASAQVEGGESLTTSATRTAHSLGELQQRLQAIDKAQTNIEKLSGDVLTLQDILSNKQTRGAFGEIQLQEIVSHALPPDAYTFQATLSNGRRADCLIHLPLPPGPIVIDSKFPLEAYEALRAASTDREKLEAARASSRARRRNRRCCSCPPRRSMPNCTPITPMWCGPGSSAGSGSSRRPPQWRR